MIELGITEDMLSSESSKSKGDSYGRAGGKKTWMQRYHGSGKRSNRDRGSSSSFHYGRELSRSPSPSSNYKTQASGHLEAVSSLHSVGISSSKTEVNESQEHLSCGYSLRSGDFNDRPPSQASNHSSQSGLTEESAERSLSQNSHGSRDSTCDRKRHLSSTETRSSSRLRARRRYESDSDDASSKERDSKRKSKLSNYDSKNDTHSSRYSRQMERYHSKRTSRQFRDKSSESDSRERDREEKDRRERWTEYSHRSRRSRGSPRRRRREWSDDEKRSQQYDTSESDGQIIANRLSVQPQGNQGDDVQICTEAQSIVEGTSHVQPMDLDTSLNNSPESQQKNQSSESQATVKAEIRPEHQAKADQDSDDIDSHVDAQLESLFDNQHKKNQSHSSTVLSDPPSSVFDFERDETPPAEIVEATAEWYRTQNVPPNFNMIPLQHVLQYYQSSMSAGRNQKDDSSWHNPSWPATSLHQRDQQQQQSATAACAYSATATSPASNTINSVQDVNLTAEHCTTMLEPKASPKSAVTNISEETDDTSFPTVQLGVPGVKTKSHDDSRVSHKWSDSEVRHQLQMFLNKAKLRAEEYSSTAKPVPGSHLLSRGGTVPLSTDMVEPSREGESDQISSSGIWQRSRDISPYPDVKSRKSVCHDKDEQTQQNVYTTPQNKDISHSSIGSSNHTLVEHPTCESYTDLMKGKESSQASSSYSLEQEIPERIRATFPHSYPPSTLCILPPSEQTTVPVFERDVGHKSDPRESYGMGQKLIQGQWKEHEQSEEHSTKKNWRAEEIWSRENVPLSRERVSDVGEWMETSASSANRMQESNSSWRGEARRQIREAPLVAADELNPPPPANHYDIYQRSTCDKDLQTSQLQQLSQPICQEHYTTTRVAGEFEHHPQPTKLSSEDGNTVRAENEKLQLFQERVVDQLPAPRNQIEQDKFQQMLDRELEERALEEENAKCREKALENAHNYAYTILDTEKVESVTTEISCDTPSAEKETEAVTHSSAVEENQHIPAKKVQTGLTTKKQVSRKYKQLQKSYYKVNNVY